MKSFQIIPFFYIIKHLPSGKMYAGCKYGKRKLKTNSIEYFMTEKGYKTSSKIVNELIKLDGLESFSIMLLVKENELATYDGNPHGFLSVQEFETWFLQENNCIGSDDWLNMSCGDGIHSKKYCSLMEKTYSNGLTGYQIVARKSAETMKHGIRKSASLKTAQTRKEKLSYGKYLILNECQKPIKECAGNLQSFCFDELKLPKSVFLDLRDKGKITFTDKDQKNIERYQNRPSLSKSCQSILICSLFRKQFDGWSSIKLA